MEATQAEPIAHDDDIAVFGHDYGDGFSIIIVDRKRLSVAVFSSSLLKPGDLAQNVAEQAARHAHAVMRWIEERVQ